MNPGRRALLAIALSLLSALFFTATYVLNRAAAVFSLKLQPPGLQLRRQAGI